MARETPLISEIWFLIQRIQGLNAHARQLSPAEAQKAAHLALEYESKLYSLLGCINNETGLEVSLDVDKATPECIPLHVFESMYDFDNDSEEEKALETAMDPQRLCEYQTAKYYEQGNEYYADVKPGFGGVTIVLRQFANSVKELTDDENADGIYELLYDALQEIYEFDDA